MEDMEDGVPDDIWDHEPSKAEKNEVSVVVVLSGTLLMRFPLCCNKETSDRLLIPLLS
jgi:hypothetical protein